MTKSLGPVKRKFSPWTDPASVPFIRFENVTKRFGDVTRDVLLSEPMSRSEFIKMFEDEGEHELLQDFVFSSARELTDRKVIRHALARTEGNISNTAKLLGISRPTLYDLLKQYDLHA